MVDNSIYTNLWILNHVTFYIFPIYALEHLQTLILTQIIVLKNAISSSAKKDKIDLVYWSFIFGVFGRNALKIA